MQVTSQRWAEGMNQGGLELILGRNASTRSCRIGGGHLMALPLKKFLLREAQVLSPELTTLALSWGSC